MNIETTLKKIDTLIETAAFEWRYYKRFDKYGRCKLAEQLTEEELKIIADYYKTGDKFNSHIKYIWYKVRKGYTAKRKQEEKERGDRFAKLKSEMQVNAIIDKAYGMDRSYNEDS